MLIRIDTQHMSGARFELQLPVIFHWSDGGDQVDGGFTEYVSQHEAWILAERPPPVGSEVRIKVLLPSPDSTVGLLRITGIGKVVRIFNETEFGGFLFHGTFDDEQILNDAGGPDPTE